jgi:APA family basic amino acid/polyamine antiporter
VGLRRTLGLAQVTLAGIGVILGAGVYALIGPAAGLAGPALWLAFLLTGVAAGCTAYAYARIGSMRPRDSPEFQYTALAFGNRVGFVAGWLMLAADLLAVATVALGFGGYLAHLAGVPVVAGALALLVAAGAILLVGVGESVGLAIALTIVEAAGLVFVIAIGVPSWHRLNLFESPQGMSGLIGGGALIFFSYLGFDELGNFAEEMRDPARNLPRALYLSMIGATLIYVLVALSATAVVDWRELSASSAPLALVARHALGSTADLGLSLVALAATANTVLLLLLAASRSVYGMADAGVLPARLAVVGPRSIPSLAALLVTGVAAVLVLPGDLTRAAALTDAAVLASFILVSLSLPRLTFAGATGARGGRYVADLAVPGLAVLMCGGLLLHTGGASIAAAVGLALLGLALTLRRGWRPPA